MEEGHRPAAAGALDRAAERGRMKMSKLFLALLVVVIVSMTVMAGYSHGLMKSLKPVRWVRAQKARVEVYLNGSLALPCPGGCVKTVLKCPHEGESESSKRASGSVGNSDEDSGSDEIEHPWPYYKIGVDEGGEKWPWPNVGWNKISLQDVTFLKEFRFFLLDDGVFDMKEAEKCVFQRAGIPANWTKDPSALDRGLPPDIRLYVGAELALLPALRQHPLRTTDPDQASLFFIGYMPLLAMIAYQNPCATLPKERKEWEDKVAEALQSSKHFQRRQGQDHVHLFLKYAQTYASENLKKLYDDGPVVLTTDKHFWSISHNLPGPFAKGRALALPYVCSSFLDVDHDLSQRKIDPKIWYFFRGTLFRRYGGRSELIELGKAVTGADFEGVKLPKGPTPDILNATAAAMFRASICPCPQGDAPTSGRLFESLAAGCVPIKISPLNVMIDDLPFPSIINWDSIALFSHSFDTLAARTDGVKRLAQVLESTVGPHASAQHQQRVDEMRAAGVKVFHDHFSYFRNPGGVATSLLLESWVLLQKHGVLDGPYNQEMVKQ